MLHSYGTLSYTGAYIKLGSSWLAKHYSLKPYLGLVGHELQAPMMIYTASPFLGPEIGKHVIDFKFAERLHTVVSIFWLSGCQVL